MIVPVVVIVDTCIFLNVLDVPGFNQHRDIVLRELEGRLEEGHNLLLPFCAILETGNHIAQLTDGGNRRRYADAFVKQVRSAISGSSPWTPTQAIVLDDLGFVDKGYPQFD